MLRENLSVRTPAIVCLLLVIALAGIGGYKFARAEWGAARSSTGSVNAAHAIPPAPIGWGDGDCSGGVNSIDALKTLRRVAGLAVFQYEPCPDFSTTIQVNGDISLRVWGDVDCSNSLNAIDALKILRSAAGLSVLQIEPCTDIKAVVDIVY